MAACTPESLLQTLRHRYATQRFDHSRKIEPARWEALEQSLVLTPSSYGLQPWRFIVITDQDLKDRLVPCSYGQRQVADCSHLVVMTVRKAIDEAYIERFLTRHAEVRSVALDSLGGFRRMLAGSAGMLNEEWAVRQVYIALGQFILAAAAVGVDTCPMEGFMPAKYDELLDLSPRGLTAAVLCPAGYRAAGDRGATAAKVRWLAEDVIEHR